MPGLLTAKQKTAASDPSNVTPEEQAQYDQFVGNGMKMLYNKDAGAQIFETLRGDGNPVEGLANALVMLVIRLQDSAEKEGQQISPDAMFHGATELLGLMAEIAEKAGIHKFTDKDKENALYLALDQYRSTRQQQGRLPEDQLKADMQDILRAEQQGTLEDVLPGVTEFAKNAPKPEDVQEQQ